VTKLHDTTSADVMDEQEPTPYMSKAVDFPAKATAPTDKVSLDDQIQVPNDEDDSSTDSSAEIFQFDVYEREGFDQIMRTVAGASDQEEAFARSVCDNLELFESMTPGREKVGYIVVCQQSMTRFGNRRFETLAEGFISSPDLLQRIVNDLHTELLVLTSRKNSENRKLVRSFPHESGDHSRKLEIVASLIRHRPAVSLLVSRIKRSTSATNETSWFGA
jgi:hypothetical protein